MIKAIKQTRKINSFQMTVIPSGRDLYTRYGERTGVFGECTCNEGELGDPVVMNGTSTIARILNQVESLSKDPILAD